jgi:hypothetical protein
MEYAPGHLRRAGSDPEHFLAEILSSGFGMREVHPETGELLPTQPVRLRDTFSVNLCLKRALPNLREDGAMPQPARSGER